MRRSLAYAEIDVRIRSVLYCRISKLRLFVVSAILSLSSFGQAAAEALPPSILVLEQSDVRGPFYAEMFSALRSRVTASKTPVTLYVENLDLSRFSSPEYNRGLQDLFRIKYQDKPISVIVALGAGALDRGLKWRSDLWRGPPIVFAFVDETSMKLTGLPPDVTGKTTRIRLQDKVTDARAVVPGLRQVALLGDRLETQPAFAHLAKEVSTISGQIDVLHMTGIPMAEVRTGIPTDQLKKVLEPFYSIKAQGLGMGRSIARTIVETHGGSISVESRNGSGAIFRVRLPLIGSEQEASR